MFQAGLLAGKRVLVTGGGTGLGKSIGRRYVELGARLIICGRRADVLDQTAGELRDAFGAAVETHVCDVRDAVAVETMMSRIWEGGPLDVLVNNAAGNFLARTEHLSSRALDAVVDIVLKGGAHCTIAAGRRWIAQQRRGTVLCILTQSALTGAPFTVPSAMAKAGLLAMIRSLAVEWGPKGIRLVGVAPGPFPTEGATSQLMPKERYSEPIENGIALRRVGRHEELADLCTFLISDNAEFITGEAIMIDGGKWLQGAAGSSAQVMQDWSDDTWKSLRK
ncbi:SDR family oxidoreductase [Noviherbaspirillum sp.]|uniref:SDR family oxidoreductase n=1 Tax=Noviherbaspirillum sp. TaxID=1926288 RepID=UPI002FE0E148